MKFAFALFLASIASAAMASGNIELKPERQAFATRSACEKALKARYRTAAAELARKAAEERGKSQVDAPQRDEKGRLTFEHLIDLTVTANGIIMPHSQRHIVTCRGRVLETRTYIWQGSYMFLPPPPPPPPPPENSKP